MILFLQQAILTLGGIAILVYVLICLGLRLWQTRMIFFPCRTIQNTPDSFNLPYENVWLTFPGSKSKPDRIHGWWLPGTRDRVILDLHGNGSNIGGNLGYAKQFHDLGYSVFLIDYRGYGKSCPRFPCEKRVYEDVELAWNYLIRDRQIPPQNIILFGHSLGGAIAIELASRHPEVAGLIVESSFTSIREMVAVKKKYGIFPVNLLLHQKFDSLSKVPRLKMPILFTHGTADCMVPAWMSEVLFAASAEPKQLLMVPDADHIHVREAGGDRYHETIAQFLENISSRSKT